MTDRTGPTNPEIRLAIATWGISHFEVPLFRILAASSGVSCRVFYLLDPEANRTFDADYGQGIDWGEEMLGGYPSEWCESPEDMRRRIRKFRPDAAMIYGYSWSGALRLIVGLWLSGVPLIFRGTLSDRRDPRSGLLGRMSRMLRPLVFYFFRTFHYGGTYSLRVLRSARIPPDRLFFVPYSVDTPYFAREADRLGDRGREEFLNTRGWPQDSRVVLFIGQLSWVKGPDIAVEAFREWHRWDPRARLVIVGSGEEASGIRARVHDLAEDGSLYLAGFCPSKQTVEWYLRSDVVLFTSRYETWARAVNEAMLCRIPCIVNGQIAASGGLVDHGSNGIVVEKGQSSEYARALERYFELSPVERSRMGEAARRKALEFSYEAHSHSLLASIYTAAGAAASPSLLGTA
ncbi:MAG TPA: glycosyltransferase family 4 protein [Thermoanaerobaculia bacterium]|nr:glycosyltransferase family 4 protein [Thermoanaerobaculia bacterium]